MNADEDNLNKINKPQATYPGSKKIMFSNSFEAAENSQIRYWAGLSPEQRFSDFYESMNRFYTFSEPDWASLKIVIDL